MRDILFRAKDLDGKWVYGGITDPCHEIENKTYIVSMYHTEIKLKNY